MRERLPVLLRRERELERADVERHLLCSARLEVDPVERDELELGSRQRERGRSGRG